MSVSPLPNVAALLAKATPGPWSLGINTFVLPVLCVQCGDEDSTKMVCEMGVTEGLDAESNARLIASAPALAAALVEAADALRYYAEGETDASGKLAQRTLARLVAFDAKPQGDSGMSESLSAALLSNSWLMEATRKYDEAGDELYNLPSWAWWRRRKLLGWRTHYALRIADEMEAALKESPS